MLQHPLDLHFHPKYGSAYWLDVLKQKGLTRADFQSNDDLQLLGPMDVEQLRKRPIVDFIPRALHQQVDTMILSETGGTTGDPCRRVFLPDEFQRGFVEPWLDAAIRFNFPKGGNWLFIGPSGPHIIAQAARAFARSVASLEPFSIDCDVRWIKQQQEGSMGRLLYMEHLVEQALNIIGQQHISVLFTTPPLLLELAERMHKTDRDNITGIHTGGMHQDAATSQKLRELFPKAVILPGYGNSLFGVTFENRQQVGCESTFFVHDTTLQLSLIPLPKEAEAPPQLTKTVKEGERGRILFHRFDSSFLIINMLERDSAVRYVVDGQESFGQIAPITFQQNNIRGIY